MTCQRFMPEDRSYGHSDIDELTCQHARDEAGSPMIDAMAPAANRPSLISLRIPNSSFSQIHSSNSFVVFLYLKGQCWRAPQI